jgi:tetratricopeptide (TPR) repeat protein
MDFKRVLRRVFFPIRLIGGLLKVLLRLLDVIVYLMLKGQLIRLIKELYAGWYRDWALINLTREKYAEASTKHSEKNLQRAIAYYQKALRFVTEQEFPLVYIRLQNELGVTYSIYSKLPTVDRTENLQKAIACYHNALRNCTGQELSQEYHGFIDYYGAGIRDIDYGDDVFEDYSTNAKFKYSLTQYNLGNAYADLPTGDRAENIQRAITHYQNALRFYTEHETESPIRLMEYARLQSKLGDAYADLPTGNRANNLQQAINYYYNAIRIYNEQEFPLLLDHSKTYATTQTRLGDVFTILPIGNREDNLQKAIICYYNTLRIYNEKKFPMGYATIQTKLGDAYTELLIGDQVENVQSAIRCYKNALRIYTEQEFPQQHTKTQNSLAMAQKKLGDAYTNLITEDQTDNSKQAILYHKDDIITYIEQTEDKAQAIACCHNLLRIFTEQDFPENYAWAQNCLGDAYRELPTGDRAQNLQQAITCYENALRIYNIKQVYTSLKQPFPKEYAWAQSCLGDAYRELPTGDRAQNLQQAITCYENALRIYSSGGFSDEYAWVQGYLGDVYRELPTGDRTKNLQQAITCYKNALRIYGSVYILTKQNYKKNFAWAQSRLGDVYRELPTRDHAENLQSAISHYKKAFRIYTKQEFPKGYAWAQRCLGDAYRELPTGDRVKNLQRAITCYKKVLGIYTEQEFPWICARIQNNLADIYTELSTKDRVENLQQAITCYKNAIRIYTEQTENQAENLRQAINCCNNMLRICTEQDFPKDYAWVQDKLRFARANLPEGDQPDNLLTE